MDIISIKLEKYAREKVRNAKYLRFVLHLFYFPVTVFVLISFVWFSSFVLM